LLISDFESPEYGQAPVVDTFENMLARYISHSEPKSLALDGLPCRSDTVGLLRRVHIIAGEHKRIGKETDRRHEEGDDLDALIRQPMVYDPRRRTRRTDTLAIAPDELIQNIREIGIREMMRFGCSRRMLDKICQGKPLAMRIIVKYHRMVAAYRLTKARAKSRLQVQQP